MLSSDMNQAFLPESVGPLIEQPVAAESVALQTTTVMVTQERATRFPIVVADGTAAWTAEGEEITPSDATVDELEVVPAKVAALSVISRELADDTSPAAAAVVGNGLVADLARQIDSAFFAATTVNGPAGLGSIAHQTVTAASYTNLDVFAEAISKAGTVGATISSFCCSPATALSLAKLKDEGSSNRPLLQPDPTQPNRPLIFGIPLITSAAITGPEVWAIPAAKTFTVLRDGATLAVDSSAYFSSDRVGVRATLRAAFGFPHAAAVVRIGPAAGS